MGGRFQGFVILADMRTGSNALEERLNAYPGIQSHGEVFNPAFVGRPNADALFGIGLKARDQDPEAMIRALRANTDGLAGFRLFSDHDPRVLEMCLADRKVAKIVLTRDPVFSYVSLKIARTTGQWWLSDLSARKSAKVRFDPAEFAEFAAHRAAHLATLRHRLQVTGQTAFWLRYDDLWDGDVIRGAARFLGVNKEPESGAGRQGRVQNPAPLSEKVTNPAEMAEALNRMEIRDPEDAPDHEPRRGPNVPAWQGARGAPVLYMPIRGAADARVEAWLRRIGRGGEPKTGFTRKGLRSWKRQVGPHVAFTVVEHPLVRAHDVFCRLVLPVDDGAFTGIRATLRRSYDVPLPDDPSDPGYDASAHRAAFLAFLRFLKGNLAGQTAVRIDSHWASQTSVIQGMAEVALPDRICRAERLDTDLADLAQLAGVDPVPPEPATALRYTLSDIWSDKIERAARRAYQKDYMMFGYGPWREGQAARDA